MTIQPRNTASRRTRLQTSVRQPSSARPATGQAGGERLIFGRIDLANFDNPKGLQQSGNSYFAETQNSGKPQYAVPGEDGTGALKNSALEMSNVDLANEFSDMITTQRGYQANSRLITVSDTMLEELINLKR